MERAIKERYFSLDLIKCVSVPLVIFCHYTILGGTVWDNVFMTLCFVAVPLFFMVNGALLFHGNFQLKRHLKKTLNVYIVGVVWRLIYLADAAIRRSIVLSALGKIQVLTYLFLWTNITGIPAGHMWFMFELLRLYILFPLMYKAYHASAEGEKLMAFTALVSFIANVGVTEMSFVWGILVKRFGVSEINFSGISAFIPYSTSCLFFFIGGALLFKNRDKINEIFGGKLQFAAGVIFLCSWGLMLYEKYLIDGTFRWNGVTFSSGYARISTALAVVSLFVLLFRCGCKHARIKKYIETISLHALGIYYLHWITARVFCNLIGSNGLRCGLGFNLLKTIAALISALVIACLLDRIPLIRRLVS